VTPARTGRTGRPPGESGTRARILAASRELFGEMGYDGASIRGIARRAEVDPALVHHYFGTKQRLFMAVMNLPFDARLVKDQLVAGGREGVGERLVRFFLGIWDEQPSVRRIMTGVVRSATTDPQAAGLLREFLGRQGLFDLVGAIAVDRPAVRTVLVGSQLIGLAMARYIVGIEPLASLDREAVVQAIGPTVERYLLGDIGPAA
jgi:AcrR family transcriptional regulator